MYCDYFGFKQEPFTIAPDPAFLYPSSPHRQALAHLKYGLDREGGFILLTGEVGTGKTTLTRLLLQQIPAVFRVAYVLNAKLDIEDVLASICDELHISLDTNTEKSPKIYIDAINANLLEAHSQGFKTLVVIEEAQNLDEEVLEMLRLLTNLETNTCKLLHILLVGQPELLDILAQPQLRQLNQRIVSRFHLDPLDRAETEKYLLHRMQKAGCSRKVFSTSSVNALYRLSHGVPRKINLLAERALLGAYSLNRDKVSRSQVIAANKEVFGLRQQKTTANQRLTWITSLLLLLVVGTVLVYSLLPSPEIESPEPVMIAADSQPQPETLVDLPEISDISVPEATRVLVIDSAGEEQIVANLPTEIELISPAEAPVEPVVVPTGPANPFSQLLGLWGIDAEVDSAESFCLTASAAALRCEEIADAAIWFFRSTNRPHIVSLIPGLNPLETSNEFYLLSSISGDMFHLERSGLNYNLTAEELEVFLAGPALYLWKPPLGYSDSVRVGESNRAVLSWLQPRLSEISPEAATLITGGRYTQPISDAVAQFQQQYALSADGILGRQTLLRFSEADQNVPTLRAVEN